MKKYLEQTHWQLNPIKPDRRKTGRWLRECFPVGTRWVYDEQSGELSGDGMVLRGPHADDIRSYCKEVEPGFGEILRYRNHAFIIGRLIDEGKLSLADIRSVIPEYEYYDEDEEEQEELSADEWQVISNWNELQRQQFAYRHWLSLDPPSEKLTETVAENEKRDAEHKEYEANINRQK